MYRLKDLTFWFNIDRCLMCRVLGFDLDWEGSLYCLSWHCSICTFVNSVYLFVKREWVCVCLLMDNWGLDAEELRL